MQRTKNWKKTRLKQGSKTKEGNQNVVVVANSPGSSLLYCRTAIAQLSPRYRYAVTLLSLRCHNAIASLLFRCRHAAVGPLSRSCHTAITPVSLQCRSAAVAPAVATLLHRYRTVIDPLSLCCCRSYCRYTVAPISHRRRAVVKQHPIRPREGINNTILNCCCSTVTPLSLLLSIGRFTRLSPQEA